MALPEEVGVREKVQVDRLQGVVRQVQKATAAHLQGADVPVGKAQLQPGELVAQEGDFKGGVVSDEGAIGDKGGKAPEGLLCFWLAFEHIGGDPVDRLHGQRDRDASVDQSGELG